MEPHLVDDEVELHEAGAIVVSLGHKHPWCIDWCLRVADISWTSDETIPVQTH